MWMRFSAEPRGWHEAVASPLAPDDTAEATVSLFGAHQRKVQSHKAVADTATLKAGPNPS